MTALARSTAVILCSLMTAAFLGWGEISGTYIGKGPTIAVLVQIVQSGDGLTGRYEQVVLKPDGTTEETNATISGAINGETVVLTLKTSDFFSATIPVSGTFRGGVLHLTGGSNLVLNLVKGDERDFRTQVAALAERSRQAAKARAEREAEQQQAKLEADRLSRLQNLTGRLTTFVSRIDSHAGNFAPTEQRLHDITERMRGGLVREQSIYGGGQAAVARSQISVALNQLAIEANQLHINVQTSYQTFDLNSGQLGREVAEADLWCPRTPSTSLAAACSRYGESRGQFSQRVASARAAFAHIEQVWTTERREQEAIVQASQVAAR